MSPKTVPRMDLHRYNIRWTSFVCFLILRTPGSDNVTKVAAFVLDLCVVAHYA